MKSFLKHVHTLSENAGLEAVKAMSSGSAVSVTGWSVVVCLFVCVCVRERERERERGKGEGGRERENARAYVRACVYVCERERGSE